MNPFFPIASLSFLLSLTHLYSATVFNADDSYAINCGSSGGSAAADGRKWIGDVRSRLSAFSIESKPKLFTAFSIESKGNLISSPAVDSLLSSDRVPYATAQASRSDFTYTFKLNPGPKFIRLHFHPSSYASFNRHSSLFSVKAGGYTLLNNFRPSITADALTLEVFTKEFCINVGENQPLRITFSPSSDNVDSFAFINGIEVISMPANLYHSIDETTALEATHRLNIGGKSIPAVEDTGMFREWLNDSSYLLMESRVLPLATTLRIRYRKGKVPSYIAPQKIYQTSWSIDSYVEIKKNYRFTWKLAVDTGFRYLMRLHFCELDYEMKEIGQKLFSISIDNQTVEENGDLIQWGGEIGFAFYRDYMFMIEGDIAEGKRDVFVSIQPHLNKEDLVMVDAILKGMEVLKLSNPDNNLAGVNPSVPPVYDSKSRGFQKILLASSAGFVVLASFIFLDWKKEKIGGGRDIGEFNCRSFSLKEIKKSTNNFSEEKVIRSDKFGTVYEGIIDDGSTKVEVRRLRCMQEEEEFTTVIKILPELKHENLIHLIGYCREKQEIILVYEHMVKGTFADHIFSNAISPLSWDGRLSVCINVAQGFNYLHTTHDTIHRDIKSTSILLNEEFIPKISDFRLCRMKTTKDLTSTHISTDVKGTTGYLDPEYFFTKRLKKESDVYSFGVVMLEALCGRPAIVGAKKERNLATWAQQCYRDGTIHTIIDATVKRDISGPCLKLFTAIANKCIHNEPTKRLTMAEVADFLRKASDFQRLGDRVNNSDVDKVINEIGIDNNQSVLSTDQIDTLNKILNSDDIGPDHLFMALEIYKTFSEFIQHQTLMKLGRRVKETLHKFEENIKSASNNNTSGGSSHNELHSLTVDVMDFMEKLSHHKETINSLRKNDNSILQIDLYFKSLISTLKNKIEEITKGYKQNLRSKFISGNRDYIIRSVQGNDSFASEMTVECVWSIFPKEKPSLTSYIAGMWG